MRHMADFQLAEEILKAGSIERDALKLALDITQEGVELLEIAERIEGFIRSRGAAPAFPVNISIDGVAAHYTPAPGDEKRIPPRSIVKVDVGVHVNGYIADAAVTVSFNPDYTGLVRAAWKGLEAAISTARDGVTLNTIGKNVYEAIKRLGYKPIENLMGHKIERYELHAGKSVPNVPALEYRFVKMRRGEVYAIEPFATDGAGYVVDQGYSNIYRVVSARRIKKEAELSKLLQELWRRFRGLPFASRWVLSEGIADDLSQLERLVKMGRVYHYPTLVEAKRGMVSQFEDTVVVVDDGCRPLAGTLSLVAP